MFHRGSGSGTDSVEAATSSASSESNPIDPNIGLTWSAVRQVLEKAKATKDQLAFWDMFAYVVLKNAHNSARPSFLISTTAQFAEFRVKDNRDVMIDRANEFLEACGVPKKNVYDYWRNPDTMKFSEIRKDMRDMVDVASDAEHWGRRKADALQPCKITLWCRFKRLGQKSTSMDFGFMVHPKSHHMQWQIVDLLMPYVPDIDALRNYAEPESLDPCAYGCSLLPGDADKSLSFDIPTESGIRTALHRALFFFKSLGFERPDESVMHIIENCTPERFEVMVGFGSKGLTRVSLRVWNSKVSYGGPVKNEKDPVKDLAEAVRCKYDLAMMEEVPKALGLDMDEAPKSMRLHNNSFIYSAEAEGYSVLTACEGRADAMLVREMPAAHAKAEAPR